MFNLPPKNHKKIVSIFPGSRRSEVDILLPILIDFIKKMNKKYNDIFYVFHSTAEFNNSTISTRRSDTTSISFSK